MEPEVIVFAAAGLISLVAFATLILVPAIGSFGRGWEKATAVVLSVIVFITLVALGVAIGFAVIYYWDEISGLFT